MPSQHDELSRIDLEIRRTHLDLAKLNVVVVDSTPRVGPRDSLRVARLKERLLVLQKERSRMLAATGPHAGPAPEQTHGRLH